MIGLNFRDTGAFVTDGEGQTFLERGGSVHSYPTSRTVGDVTFNAGFVNQSGLPAIYENPQGRNRDATVIPELAGAWLVLNSGIARIRVELPEPGAYSLRLALGDTSFSTNSFCRIFDGDTLLATVSDGVATAQDEYVDATGVVRSESVWLAENEPLTLSFSSRECRIEIGEGGESSGESEITHFSFEQVTGLSVSASAPLVPGESTTISTSNFESAPTGARITDSSDNTVEIELQSDPLRVSLPALGNQPYVLFGDVTLEVYNETESAITTVAFNPPDSHQTLVTLPEIPSNLTETGYLFNWSPDNGYEGVQIISPVGIDNQGNWIDVADGTYTLYAIDPVDGEMQAFTGTFGDVDGGGDPDPTLSADFTFNVNGREVYFSASSEYTGSGTVTYSWEFTGGSPETSTGQYPTVNYPNTTASYSVTLTATDGTLTDIVTKTVNITASTSSQPSVVQYRGPRRVRSLAKNATQDIVGNWLTVNDSKSYGFVAQGTFGGATVRFEQAIVDRNGNEIVLAQDPDLSFTVDGGLVVKYLPEGIRVRPIIESSGVDTDVSIYLTV